MQFLDQFCITITTGSVGARLSDTNSSLFTSHDGGLTWRFAKRGRYYHRILDQGGALVATDITNAAKSNAILYAFALTLLK